MRHPLPLYALPAAALLLLPGCIDDNYDLANVDTTTQLKVNDLTVPINLNTITLEKVTDLSDNEFIDLVTEGDKKYYAFKRTESFQSGNVHISSFTIPAPRLQGVTIPLSPSTSGRVKRDVMLNPFSNVVDIDFSTTLPNGMGEGETIGTTITAVDYIGTQDTDLTVTITPPAPGLRFHNLQLQFPANLDVIATSNGTYNKTNGILTVGDITVNSVTNFTITFNGIDEDALSVSDRSDPNDPTKILKILNLNGKIGIAGTGELDYKGSLSSTNPSMSVLFNINDIKATTLSASVDLKIKSIDFQSIALDGLPEFLDGETTSINAANPQIYVGVDNTVGDFSGTTKLTFTSLFSRPDGSSRTTNGTTPEAIKVNQTDRTNIFLHKLPEAIPTVEGYLNPTPGNYVFPTLNEVLYAGEPNWGLPKSIHIEASDVSVNGSKVKNFPLNTYQPGFVGTYTVFVPLAFETGSFVQYSSTDADWNTGDLSDLEINKLHVKAVATSSIPFDLELTVVPLDESGKEIPVANSSKMTLPAGATDVPVALEIEAKPGQPIKGIGGITYQTIVKAVNAQDAISPDTEITLKDIKITVDGAWVHKF